MGHRFLTCDVFTDTRFGGNPLAVVPDGRGIAAATMQAVAREFNLSETVFVLPPDDPRHQAKLRIFTPARELPFAGHPTVGAAFTLATIGALPAGARDIVLEEGVGPVPVRIDRVDGRPAACTLTAARRPERGAAAAPPDTQLAALLSLDPGDVAAGAETWSCGLPYLVIPLQSVGALERCRVDSVRYDALLGSDGVDHLYPVARVDATTWRVRMFAPALGVAEDPATGSAAASFAGWLARHDPGGAPRYRLLQGAEIGRPSRLELEIDRDGEHAAVVRVGGSAVMVSEGTIEI